MEEIQRERGADGATAPEIAEQFLQAKGAAASIAGPIVKAMLGKDPRFDAGEGRSPEPSVLSYVLK